MDESLQRAKFERLTTSPVERLVVAMAIPSVISMLISALYNMADTFFIGKISTQATGAIGIVFSYMALVQAIAFFFGHGSGNYVSRKLGQRETEAAEQMVATGFFSALLASLLLVICGFLFMDPILLLLGATKTILPDARKYFTYILLATPFMLESFVLNNQMRLQGNAKRSTIGIATGAILNIVLDPILIFKCNLGISGAAIATAVSQFVSFVILVIVCGKGGGIPIRLRNFSPRPHLFREIFEGGIPSLGRQGLQSVAVICLNRAVGVYGDSAIAAFSVVSRITMMMGSAVIGVGQGFQPVCGFNYGAGLFERVRKAFWFTVRVITITLIILAALALLFTEPIIMAFRDDDAELVAIAVRALRLQALTMPLLGWIVPVNMYLQNTRKTIRATIVAVARQGIVFIPMLFLLSKNLSLLGVQLTQPVSDVLTFFIAIPLGVSGLREMRKT